MGRSSVRARKYWIGFAKYWVVAVLLAVGGVYAGKWLGDRHYWIDLRYDIHQWMTQSQARPARRHRTVVVIVGDEEYWKGAPAGRAPLKRSYLAKLIGAVAAAAPEVIAVDFDLRSPTPDGSPVRYTDYEAENRQLFEAFKAVPRGTTLVLPKTLGFDDGYVAESDIFDGAGLDPARVRRGYIALPNDLRTVPLELHLRDGSRLDSFAQAAVRASEPTALEGLDGGNEEMPYGHFMRREEFPSYLAAEVLGGDASVLRELSHKVVIIGGAWHANAYMRGPGVDVYHTPVGPIPGAFIHANFIEALLDGRTSRPWGHKVGTGVEIIFSLAVALIFFLDIKRRWKLPLLVLLPVALVLFSYFSWQNLGMFFDFFIPLVLLAGHYVIEHWLHLREQVRHLRASADHPFDTLPPTSEPRGDA